MKSAIRVVVVLVGIVVLAGCATGQRPAWTYSPPSPSAGPSGQASSQPSVTPTAQPQIGDSVVPVLTPKGSLQPVPAGEVNVAYAPNVPPAATRTNQAIVDVHFDIVEGVKAIDPNGLEYTTWGYRLHGDGTVTTGTPGPIIRARVGDVLRFTLTNDGTMPHNVDFHAVTGQGGGAKDLTVAPGETATIEARLLYPGLFMYHCAAGDVPLHISQGMYGGILVDPETPLSAVEHELYMVQSEYYTTTGADGNLTTDRSAITNETPTFVVFNGAKGALTGDNAPKMRVGEKMRIYFVDAGLNLDSNFHPIGSHWDKVWEDGGLLNAPLRGLQTVVVPAGGSTVVELDAWVPMTVVLVDHALARAFDKGAIGQIVITGDPNVDIFEFTGKSGSPAPTAAPGSPTPVPTTPAPSASASASPGEGYHVDIVPGAFTFQAADAADEFADSESPMDYNPNVLMIPVGSTVTWTNHDPNMIHTVTAADGSFDSGFMAEGDSWSYTFENPGTFDYSCTPHPWMKGRIEVMLH